MLLNIGDTIGVYTVQALLSATKEDVREVYQVTVEGGPRLKMVVYSHHQSHQQAFLNERATLSACKTNGLLGLDVLETGSHPDAEGRSMPWIVTNFAEDDGSRQLLSGVELDAACADCASNGILTQLVGRMHEIFRVTGALHMNITPVHICVYADGAGQGCSVTLNGLFNMGCYPYYLIDRSLLDNATRPPEASLGNFCEASVQWSLAMTIYAFITGRYPWPVDGSMDSYRVFTIVRRQEPDLSEAPEGSEEFFARALNRTPSKRYASLTEMVAEASRVLGFPLPDGYSGFDLDGESIPESESGGATPKIAATDSPRFEKNDDQPRGNEPRIDVAMVPRKGDGFKAVAGMETLKSDLTRDFINLIHNRGLADQYGLKVPSMILYGPPGTGKTYLSMRLAEELGLDFTLVTPSDLANIYIHGTQSLIRQLFDKAEKHAKSNKRGVLMVFDEMDAVCPQRTADDKGANQAGEVSEFLTQLNNCAERGIYVIGTTNRIDRIDRAILRKGRMDKVVYVGLPDEKMRAELFRYELAKRPHSQRINYGQLASLTEGFSSADIAYVIDECSRRSFEASLRADKGDAVKIKQPLIEEVIAKTSPSVSRADLRHYERMRDDYVNAGRSDRPSLGFTAGE